MLERLSFVKVLHAVEKPGHHLATLLLIEVLLPDGVPQFLQAVLPVSVNDLLVSATQVHRDLCPLEPLLHRLLRLKESNILLQSLLLDAESAQNSQHFFHAVVGFAQTRLLNAAISSVNLCLLNLGHLLGLAVLLHNQLVLGKDEFLENLLLCVLAPAVPGLAQI